MKKIKLGVLIDPLEKLNPKKDSTIAVLEEAQNRGWEIFVFYQPELSVEADQAYASVKTLSIDLSKQSWFEVVAEEKRNLADLDVIFMRKDPPFDLNYIYSTYILELAEKQSTLVINKPQSLRDVNEKAFISHFPQCAPETIFSMKKNILKEFVFKHRKAVLKPLDTMGGKSVFIVDAKDLNLNVIIETLTKDESELITAQQFIPEIKAGDKRILLINGKPIPYALARIPSEEDNRANLATGGTGKVVELSEKDYWICQQLEPMLKEKQLPFVGIDVIGDYLTEINVTSPTCIREIEKETKINIAGKLLDFIEKSVAKHF